MSELGPDIDEPQDGQGSDNFDIAIIGMAGRFPGASSVDELWQALADGKELISHFSRAELAASGVAEALLDNPDYVMASPVLKEDPGLFDAAFFGYTPREASITDPQHRIFLETAWEALENAGYEAGNCNVPVGVFGGAAMNTYFMFSGLIPNFYDEYIPILLGNDNSYLASRVSFKLNLNGPSMTLQTACSTSLVAVHMACQSLLNEECDMALAGGVSVRVPHKVGYRYSEGGVAAPDGHCRTFDAKAEGTLFGSGAGVVVLKRLDDAIADRDHIVAVIKGTAVNNDGASKLDFTAPSVGAQAEVISQALSSADVPAESISYVEAHGTGTYLGDPIEVAALTRAFRRDTDLAGFCAIGSVKTNIGHLDAAAGAAGLIKTAMALQRKEIPASLNFENPNPQIDFESSPFYVNAETVDWWTGPGEPRRAGVSALGIGGTNAHLVLEEAPALESSSGTRSHQLLLLSGRSEKAVEAGAARLSQHLKGAEDLLLADVAYTLQVGRKKFSQRAMLVSAETAAAIRILDGETPGLIQSRVPDEVPAVVFMFPDGPGLDSIEALDLYESEPLFRQEVERCVAVAGSDLKNSNASVKAFTLQYALAKLLMSWGVEPATLIGQGVGNYTAACLAGVISLDDVLRFLMLDHASPLDARRSFFEGIALESPQIPMVSSVTGDFIGPEDAVDASYWAQPHQEPLRFNEGVSRLLDDGARALLEVGAGEALNDLLRQQQDRRVSQLFFSTLGQEGAALPGLLETLGRLWLAGIEIDWRAFTSEESRRRVPLPTYPFERKRFWRETSLESLCQSEEATKSQTAVPADASRVGDVVQSGSLPAAASNDAPLVTSLKGMLYEISGIEPADLDATAKFADLGIDSLMLTQVAVALQREFSFKIALKDLVQEAGTLTLLAERMARDGVAGQAVDDVSPAPTATPSDLAGSGCQRDARRADIGDWFYVPSWARSPAAPIETQEAIGPWLLFADDRGLCEGLSQALLARGEIVVTVTPGAGFKSHADNHYSIKPDSAADYAALLSALREAGRLPTKILHAWSYGVEIASSDEGTAGEFLDRGFFSLLYLAQSLGGEAADIEMDCFILTDDLCALQASDTIDPMKATLFGPCRVLPKEMPDLQCRIIDLPTYRVGTLNDQLTDLLLAEFQQNSPQQLVAYRDGERWVQTFAPHYLAARDGAAQDAPALRKSGVYLITGGLGSVGALIANYLARDYQADLILIGRTELPATEEWDSWLEGQGPADPISEKILQIRALEALGSRVLALSVDVSNRRQLDAAIQKGVERFGGLNGIVHAAGILKDGIAQFKDPRDSKASFAPKIFGTANIETLIDDLNLDLDFVALFSSTHAILAPAGQLDHCAANAYLDQLAQSKRNGEGCRFLSINWPPWIDVGLLADDSQGAWIATARAKGIKSQEGIEVFRRALASDAAQLVVSPTDFLASLPTTAMAAPGPEKDAVDVAAGGAVIREANKDDFDGMMSLLDEAFPRFSAAHWKGIFDYGWCDEKPNLGFVIANGTKIVGYIGTIYAEREIDGQPEKFCNGVAWYVQPAYRTQSMDLLLSFAEQPGQTITALTPNETSGAIMEALGFSVLERFTRFVPPFLQAPTLFRSGAPRVLTDVEEIKPHLSAAELKILRDHEGPICHHYLALCEAETCYIVTKTKLRAAIRFSQVLHVSNRKLMMRYFEKIKLRILFSEMTMLLKIDERMCAGQLPLGLRRPKPRYFISKTLKADQIDSLYTEYVLLPQL